MFKRKLLFLSLLASVFIAQNEVKADCQFLVSTSVNSQRGLGRVSTAGRLFTFAPLRRIWDLAVTEAPEPKIYFTDIEAKEIVRAELDGSNPQVILRLTNIPLSIALHGSHIYWSVYIDDDPQSSGAIYRMPFEGSLPELLIANVPQVPDITFAPNGRLYWLSTADGIGSVYSATSEGEDIRLVADLNELSARYGQYQGSSIPAEIVVDPIRNKFYIRDRIAGWAFAHRVVWRMDVDGSNGELFAEFKGFISRPTTFAALTAIALDSRRDVLYAQYSGDVSGTYRLPIGSDNIPYHIGTSGGDFMRDFRFGSQGGILALLGVEHGFCQGAQNLTAAEREDFIVWRPSLGQWFAVSSSSQSFEDFISYQWGLPDDIPLVGNFNGDSVLDLIVWRNSTGNWHLCDWSDSGACRAEQVVQFGLPGDVPMVADFDLDGLADLVVWRPSEGEWYYQSLQGGVVTSRQWGLPGDVPLLADFDGDELDDFVVYRPSSGTWYVLYSSTPGDGTTRAPDLVRQWGLSGDIPIIGNYDDDNLPDLAVWRPTNGTWYICSSETSYDCHRRGREVQFGLNGDVPLRGDYNGDGKDDLTVWRPSIGTWFYHDPISSTAISRQWGLPGDVPLSSPR